MSVYVAYHSAAVMGRPYQPDERFTFFSRKPEKYLLRALSSQVWVIASDGVRSTTRYQLIGSFIPADVSAIDDGYAIAGPGTVFSPPLEVTNLRWFQELRREQNNFSFGFNEIRSVAVLEELATIRNRSLATFPEEVSEREYREGDAERVFVNKYERDRGAREACIRANGTTCVICGTDLSTVYGPIADGLVHVHHLAKISEAGGSKRVDPEKDLIVVCPNCHAVLHRRNPPILPEELRELLRTRLHIPRNPS